MEVEQKTTYGLSIVTMNFDPMDDLELS